MKGALIAALALSMQRPLYQDQGSLVGTPEWPWLTAPRRGIAMVAHRFAQSFPCVSPCAGSRASRAGGPKAVTSKPPPLEWIVVRIEVSDTGCGIRRKDMVQSKLFCACARAPSCASSSSPFLLAAFNQTEMGRLQGTIG